MARSQEEFIEEVGLTTEGDGLPRIAGRLFGYLLVSPGPRSLDEIADALAVSKGSASTDARLLLRHGWLRRVSQPGDRKDYYEMAPDFFAEIVSYRLARWDALHELVSGASPALRDAPPEALDRLAYLERAQRFFVEGMRALLSEWRIANGESASTKTTPTKAASTRQASATRGAGG